MNTVRVRVIPDSVAYRPASRANSDILVILRILAGRRVSILGLSTVVVNGVVILRAGVGGVVISAFRGFGRYISNEGNGNNATNPNIPRSPLGCAIAQRTKEGASIVHLSRCLG